LFTLICPEQQLQRPSKEKRNFVQRISLNAAANFFKITASSPNMFLAPMRFFEPSEVSTEALQFDHFTVREISAIGHDAFLVLLI
jgi:hypothetical protein